MSCAQWASGCENQRTFDSASDFAGTVEAVGKNVTQYKPGDDVFGGSTGAFAQYLCRRATGSVALKPAGLSFEQAAAINIAGITALQAVRDKGKVGSGQKVLINGASGGVGTFAVQLAKSYGADVTGVCSARNIDLVQSLGADHVIDYTKEDFTKGDQRYDVVIDNVANHSLSECRRVLTPNGIYVMIGGGGANEQGFVGALGKALNAAVYSHFVKQKMGMMMAQPKQKDLALLADMVAVRKIEDGDRPDLQTRGSAGSGPLCRGRPRQGQSSYHGRLTCLSPLRECIAFEVGRL